MSGSSLDGADGTLVSYEKCTSILAHAYHPFSDSLRRNIDKIRLSKAIELTDFCKLSSDIADEYSVVVKKLSDHSIKLKRQIDVIGAHGQTIWHQPPLYSIQICNYARLAHKTGISVVGDFRNADIANGGTGAPLAPLFHTAAFYSPEEKRSVINLGGIANISVLGKPTLGWDIGPGVTLIDSWYAKHNSEGSFDIYGKWARGGKINHKLLECMLGEAFFSQEPPKSTGQEIFNINWIEGRIRESNVDISAQDVQSTLTELTALLCKKTIDKFAPKTDALYFCGGGTKNTYLMERLAEVNQNTKLHSTKKLGIEPEHVECGLISWLAVKHILGEPVITHHITGSQCAPKILGALYPAVNHLAASRA
ncbi:anhydro-N-acetylmuramic acid kinase [Candidatus Ichthyocystis sparus]|nr:anhydro-N-acetylmuramic acid kinase [Candidatus Ichthyocystis sparus]